MSTDATPSYRLERLLAETLHYGTWLASIVIAVGLTLALIGCNNASRGAVFSPNMPIVSIGIALFILLPVLRVILMLTVFLRQRDYRFGAVAALVLVIIFVGFVLGALSASHLRPA